MTAKEYLSQAFHIDQRISSKLSQVMRLREAATNCTATLTDMPRPDSPSRQQMADTICKIVDLEREINEDIDRLVGAKREAMAVIRQVEHPDQQLVLELRYLDFKSWPSIAEEMGLSPRWVQTLHERALAAVENIFSQKA